MYNQIKFKIQIDVYVQSVKIRWTAHVDDLSKRQNSHINVFDKG